jgi:hypothetical protein
MSYMNSQRQLRGHAMNGLWDDFVKGVSGLWSRPGDSGGGGDAFAPIPDIKVVEEASTSALPTVAYEGGATLVSDKTGKPITSREVVGNYVKVKGVALATNATALERLKDLQRAANRVAAIKGFTVVVPDGKIGNMTVGLLKQIMGTLAAFPSPSPQYVQDLAVFSVGDSLVVANNSQRLTDLIGKVADAYSAPAVVPTPPPSSPPVIVTPGPTLDSPMKISNQGMGASLSDVFARMSTIQKAGLAAGLVGIGALAYYTTKKK